MWPVGRVSMDFRALTNPVGGKCAVNNLKSSLDTRIGAMYIDRCQAS